MQLIRSVLYPAAVAVLSVAIASPAVAQVVVIDTTVKVDTTAKTDSTIVAPAKIIVNQDQAVRGLSVFTKTCVACHTNADVTGADFKIKWDGRPVWDLYDVIRTTMPDDNPGGMTPAEYIDVVAYLVRINGAASGGAAFAPTDTAGLKLAKMEIQVPAPNVDSVKVDTTKVDTTKVDTTKVDTTKVDTTKIDTTKVDTLRARKMHPKFSARLSPTPTQPYVGINHLFVKLPQRTPQR